MAQAKADADLVIVGGGPAGMMAGLLFARAGLRTIVLEKHSDFLRDFRGDTVHPSTLALLGELGMLDAFLARPHDEVVELKGRVAGRTVRIADFGHLPVPARFIALMPQWDFLDFLAERAARYPGFELRRSCAADGLIAEGGRVAGVRLSDGGEIRARLVIAADGRSSVLRAAAGLRVDTLGAPMDVFWFRLPKSPGAANDTLGIFETGRLFVMIDRRDYWQCALVFPKGSADAIRAAGLPAFRKRIAAMTAGLAVDSLESWDQIKLLTVALDRLRRWHRPGLLCIGDAAHAMSPIGGVGINLAVQDAVAAANILAGPMARGRDPDMLLAAVQSRRMLPTRIIQAGQRLVQGRIIAPLLSGATIERPPLAVRLLDRFQLLRRIPARVVGLGIRREHIRSPDVSERRPSPSRD